MWAMGPVVAVEVAPAAPTQRQLAVLLDSCSAALPSGTCEWAGALAPGTNAAATARVEWASARQVRIEVELADGERAQLTREFTFPRDDPSLERFRTIGLTIATIVDELRAQSAGSETAPASEPERPVEAQSAGVAGRQNETAVASPPHDVRSGKHGKRAGPGGRRLNAIETGASFGTGLASGTTRIGLWLAAARQLEELPAFARIEVGYAVRTTSGEPSVTWNEFVLGGGFRSSLGEVRADVSGLALLARTAAGATHPQTGVTDRADTWLPGFGLAGRVEWPRASPLAATFGVRALAMLRSVTITNAGTEVARIPAYNVGLVGGLRLGL